MNPVVITRLANGSLCATGMSNQTFDPSAPGSSFLPSMGLGWDYVAAQLAMLDPAATALKPGESVTIDFNQPYSDRPLSLSL